MFIQTRQFTSEHFTMLFPVAQKRLYTALSSHLQSQTFKHNYRSPDKRWLHSCKKDIKFRQNCLLPGNTDKVVTTSHYLMKNQQIRSCQNLISHHDSLDFPLNNRQDYINYFGSSLKRWKGKHLYLFDDPTADRIIDILKPYLDSESQVIEIFPGAGLLSKRFLESDINKLVCLEPRTELIPLLKGQMKKDSRMEYEIGRNINFMMFKKMLGTKPQNWDQKSKLKFFVLVPVTGYFFLFGKLPKALVHQEFIYKYGRVPVFCLMSRLRLDQYVNKKDGIYKSKHSIFYNLLFDVEILEKVDRNLFDPLPKYSEETADDDMLLVKILPKENVLEIFGSLEKLRGFHFFTTQLMLKKHDRVIPRLEHWAPGCGSRLVAQGYNMMDKVLGMSVESLVELYFDFMKWPELQNSAFLAALGHHTGTEEKSFCNKRADEIGSPITSECEEYSEVNPDVISTQFSQ